MWSVGVKPELARDVFNRFARFVHGKICYLFLYYFVEFHNLYLIKETPIISQSRLNASEELFFYYAYLLHRSYRIGRL